MAQNMNRQERTAQLLQQLEQAGVQVITLAGGAVRLHGKFNNVLVTSDVLNLRPNEIERLCLH